MKLWIDSQLSPALAPWIVRELGIEAVAVVGHVGWISVAHPPYHDASSSVFTTPAGVEGSPPLLLSLLPA